MDNETVLAYEEEIAVGRRGIATVTAVITTDNWTQWTTDDSIIQFFENSTSINNINASITTSAENSTNSTIQNFVNAINVWNIFEEIPWLLWVVIGAGASLIIVVVATIITCMAWNKKSSIRKSRRDSSSDQRIVGSSESISQFMWPRWMLCCPKSVFERQEDLRRMRQNSASNLDPYRRPPLPSINFKDTVEDGFNGNFLPPRRLEPIRTTESHLNALMEKTENAMMLGDARDHDDNDLFGTNITGIQGVPVMPVKSERRRPLPVPPSDCFNHL